MKYTIDDLRGKYVKVGTPECDEFLKACVDLDVTWVGGISAKFVTYNAEFIGISKLIYDPITLGHSREEYWVRNHFVPFVPKTDTTPRTTESSAVKTLESLPDTMTIGEMVDSGQSVFGGRITQCDDVDDTVTQRGERYGLFADGAVIMQDLKAIMRATPGWERLTPSQREALEMIQHKIGRVLNGDPTYDDSWRDISGYSTLILNELNGVKR